MHPAAWLPHRRTEYHERFALHGAYRLLSLLLGLAWALLLWGTPPVASQAPAEPTPPRLALAAGPLDALDLLRSWLRKPLPEALLLCALQGLVGGQLLGVDLRAGCFARQLRAGPVQLLAPAGAPVTRLTPALVL